MKKISILSVVWLCGISLFYGCAEEKVAVDMTPPQKVEIIPRSPDSTYIEQGIDAVPEADYIVLSWESSPANDLAGYRIYRLEHNPEVDPVQTMIEQIEPGITSFEDRDPILAPDQITGLSTGFSYWVSAFDESGNESSLSEEAYYKLLLKPVLSEPQIENGSLVLSWSYDINIGEPWAYFVVRLYQLIDNTYLPFWVTIHELPFPLEVAYDQPLQNGLYKYQVDVVGASPDELPSGSESEYYFTIP